MSLDPSDLVLKKPLSMLKTVVLLNIFVFLGFFDEQKIKKNIYLKFNLFGNIINVFTVIFDQFNVLAKY